MNINTCPYEKIEATTSATRVEFLDFSFVPTAHAQSNISNNPDLYQNLNAELTLPFYLLIGSCFLFAILMSFIYIYHWNKFNLGDPYVKNFTPVYFFGLLLISLPIIFNLFF